MSPPLMSSGGSSRSGANHELRPLCRLPFSALILGLFVTTITSSRVLMNLALRLLFAVARNSRPDSSLSTSSNFNSGVRQQWQQLKRSVFSVQDNPLLRAALKASIYRCFCAGESTAEVEKTIRELRQQGVRTVLLGWAREAKAQGLDYHKSKAEPLEEGQPSVEVISADRAERLLREWTEGTLQTIRLTPRGSFTCLKFTGAGPLVVSCLVRGLSPPPAVAASFKAICELASDREVRIIIDAERFALKAGIDLWSLDLQRQYNRTPLVKSGLAEKSSSLPLIYSTYQAYLRNTPSCLMKDLQKASRADFTLGVKLVRGAYLGSDPRSLIWADKDETDDAYDALAATLIRRQWPVPQREQGAKGQIEHFSKPFPQVALVLATHNLASVRKALSLSQAQIGQVDAISRTNVAFAQLMGMADHITGELTTASLNSGPINGSDNTSRIVQAPTVCKYLVWGSVDECVLYLVRRAEENRDATLRTKESKAAILKEIANRVLKKSL